MLAAVAVALLHPALLEPAALAAAEMLLQMAQAVRELQIPEGEAEEPHLIHRMQAAQAAPA